MNEMKEENQTRKSFFATARETCRRVVGTVDRFASMALGALLPAFVLDIIGTDGFAAAATMVSLGVGAVAVLSSCNVMRKFGVGLAFSTALIAAAGGLASHDNDKNIMNRVSDSLVTGIKQGVLPPTGGGEIPLTGYYIEGQRGITAYETTPDTVKFVVAYPSILFKNMLTIKEYEVPLEPKDLKPLKGFEKSAYISKNQI